MILNVTFNVASDLVIFIIPLPFLFKAKLPWKRKILLMLPFSMGVFTIFAAIICKVEALLLDAKEWWGLWCYREVAMGVIVANVPYGWGLLRCWTARGSFAPPTRSNSVATSSLPTTSDSTTSLLRAVRNSISFAASRRRSMASEEWPSQTLYTHSEKGQINGTGTFGRTWQFPASTAGRIAPNLAKPSIATVAVDKLYKLDFVDDDNVDELCQFA